MLACKHIADFPRTTAEPWSVITLKRCGDPDLVVELCVICAENHRREIERTRVCEGLDLNSEFAQTLLAEEELDPEQFLKDHESFLESWPLRRPR